MIGANAFLLLIICGSGGAQAENWAGPRGGGGRANASAIDVDPSSAGRLWIRSFPAAMFGDQEKPNNEMSFAGARGSHNLALVDGRIAVLAAHGEGFPESHYATILDAASGAALNCVQVRSNIGNTRVYLWPYFGVSMSMDAVTGMATIQWDPQTGMLFIGQGAYNSAYTAYDPMANAAGFKEGAFQPGVPAFERLAAKHPDYEDAFGKTRQALRTVIGTGQGTDPVTDGLAPWAWGLSGFEMDSADAKGRYDAGWTKVHGKQGSSHYNTSAWFVMDPDGPFLGTTKGADWGHNVAGDAYLFHKLTGMRALVEWPKDLRLPEEGIDRLRPFTHDGILISGGRLFCIGPSEDRDGDKRLGTRRPKGLLPKMDQGLAVWAYDLNVEDRRPNGGVEGPAAHETFILRPLFAHFFPSRFQPDADIDSHGQSYYETDGLHRPKAMLADGGGGLWAAWKPDRASGAELIHATAEGAKAFSLGVGANRKGADLWPKLSRARVEGRELLVFYTGYAAHRKRVMMEDPEPVLKTFTHRGNRWEDLDAKARADTLKKSRRLGCGRRSCLRSPDRRSLRFSIRRRVRCGGVSTFRRDFPACRPTTFGRRLTRATWLWRANGPTWAGWTRRRTKRGCGWRRLT